MKTGNRGGQRRGRVLLEMCTAALVASGASGAWPLAARAEQALLKIPRVGILSVAQSDRTPIFDALREGLRDLGYVEGRNIILEFRLAHGDFSLLPKLAAELVNLPADIIVADNGLDVLASATRTTPIVADMGDPMLFGISSLSRPGGNVTGFSLMHKELSGKRLEMLRTSFPDISAVAVLRNPANLSSPTNFRATEEAARSMGVATVTTVVAGSSEELLALRPTVFAGVGGVVVLGDGMFWNHRRDIVALVAAARLPAIYPEREYVEDNGLMAYGGECAGHLPPDGGVCRPDSEGRQSRRLAGSAAGEVRLHRQPQDREVARPHRPAIDSPSRRRGDRVTARPSVGPMRATLLALILTVLPTALQAGAQQPANIPTVGWLGANPETGPHLGFRSGLRELGYAEGHNIAIEYRFSEGKVERYAEQIEELGRLNAKVIVTDSFPATKAAKQARLAIPVVFVSADPVGAGFVNSLAHPGGNMTGLSLMIEGQFSGKWLELLKEAVPQVSRLAYLWNPANPSNASSWRTMQELAPTIRVTLQSVEIRDRGSIDDAFAAIIRDRAEGIIVGSDPVNGGSNQARIIEFVAANHLPAISAFRGVAASGGLMSYGPNLYELGRRAAAYVDKILKGARPADLPVEQPITFELVINLKTAKSLGLTIPHSLLLRADEVIE
jgi:putative ABC transport system substrate-binding protein